MGLQDDFDRIERLRARLNVAADIANERIRDFEAVLTASAPGVRAQVLLDGEAEGWSIAWTRWGRGWRLVALHADRPEYQRELTSAPRLVRLVALDKLPALVAALADRLEEIVGKDR